MELVMTFYSIVITWILLYVLKEQKSTNKTNKIYTDALEKVIFESSRTIVNNTIEIRQLKKELVDINSNNIFHKIDNTIEREMMDLSNFIQDLRAKTESEINNNKDIRIKEVGDRVKLWDYSYHQIIGKPNERLDLKYSEEEAIVIEQDLKLVGINEDFGLQTSLDLCIRFSDDTKVYTASRFVKRID